MSSNGTPSNKGLSGEEIRLGNERLWTVRTERDSGETLLFLHGIPTNSHLWRNIQGPLAEEHATIAVDLLGFGRSQPSPGHSLTLKDQAGTLAQLLDHLGVERVTIIAHDVGGGVAFHFAELFPERVRGMVLMDVGAFARYWPVLSVKLTRLPLLGDLIKIMPQGLRRMFLKNRLKRGLFYRDRLSGELFEEYARRPVSKEGRDDFLKFLRALDAAATERALRAVAAHHAQRLILWARHDRYQPSKEGQQLFDLFDAGKLVHIADAGHFLQEDQPERVTAKIRTYLKGLPPLD